jgi:hypothetical protein
MAKYIDSNYLFQSAGDFIALNAWLPEDIIDQVDALNQDDSKILRKREGEGYNGPKALGVEYNFVPEGWGLPANATELGSLLYDRGHYLAPHRDKWRNLNSDGSLTGDGMRLINFINHTHPTEFTFLLDDEVKTFEPRRWYAVNTRKTHYGFSFVDGVYHMSCGIRFGERHLEETVQWLKQVLPFAQPDDDVKGVICTRN